MAPATRVLAARWCSRAWLCYWGASGGWRLRDTAIKYDGRLTHAPWNKCAATGVTRVGLLFTRGELTCCSRARMLGVKCR